MALWDEVKARYPATFLTNLTNPETTGQSVPNDTIGTKASADVQADFLTYANLTYVDGNAQHIALGVTLVISKLHRMKGLTYDQDREEEQRSIQKLRDLALSRGMSKFTTTVNTPYTPSNPNPNGDQIMPPFDEGRFASLLPNRPEF